MGRNESDEELMLAYQLGEADAFDELYARHAPRVLGYLRKRLGNEADARDAFQGTFLKLHRCRAQYRGGNAFLPWLFVICRSECIDAARHRHRIAGRESAWPEQEPAANETPPLANSVSTTGLPGRQRTAIRLRYEDELSFEEIARRLETSPQNARQLISRGVRFLRGIYEKK